MKILGIDPSFSSTGLAIVENGILLDWEGVSCGGSVYQGNDSLNVSSKVIADKILNFTLLHNPDCVILEYPAQTRSGFYLMSLHGWIVSSLWDNVTSLYSVPPKACDSFIMNKEHSKSFIVSYCKDKEWVPNVRINNDICTAVVLTHILEAFMIKKYKNKVFCLKSS